MKIIPFQIPKTNSESIRVQRDELPFFYDKLHQHPEIQITSIISGEGTLITGNTISHFKPGNVFVIGSNVPHVLRSHEKYYGQNSEKCSSLSVYFDVKFGGKEFAELSEMQLIHNFFSRSGIAFFLEGKLRTTIEEKISQLEQSEGFEKLILFLSMLNEISTGSEMRSISFSDEYKNFNEKEGQRMNDVLQFTFSQSHRQISIGEVADVAHLSPEAFCRFFKLRTRKTYIHFLNEVRINNACKLLESKDQNISDVCFKTGFNNLSNFNRIFKKLTGYSPKQYQKMEF